MAIKGRWSFALKEIPTDIVIHRFLSEKTDFQKHVDHFSAMKYPDYLEIPVSYDMDLLVESVREAINLYGLHQFDYSSKNQAKLESYVSSSLTWNPEAIDKVSNDPHRATLGSSALMFGSASQYDQPHSVSLRNTYSDTYSFVERTPFSNHKEIKRFLDTFSRTLVRSRVSTILANKEESTGFDYSWHNDELIFINLRINVPVETNGDYALQIMSEARGEQLNITEFSMKKGFSYVYDTNKYHRPVCKKLNSEDRIHMICGVSPWFDFNRESQCWESNEYYGELHPFQMLEMGLITSTIKKDK